MIDLITSKLEKLRPHGHGRWMACCPAHEDKSPSLAITELRDGRILIKCFAGCEILDVLSAIGLTMSDLFPGGSLGEFKGWQQLQHQSDQAKQRRHETATQKDRTILTLAESDRKAGVRLSPQDLEVERQAYKRVRDGDC